MNSNARFYPVQVMLSFNEKSLFQEEAKKRGFGLSTWLRTLGLKEIDAAFSPKEPFVEKTQTLPNNGLSDEVILNLPEGHPIRKRRGL